MSRRVTKIVPHPSLKSVTNWPHEIEGILEIFDVGDPEDEGEIVPSWILCHLRTGAGESCTFSIYPEVLSGSGIGYHNFDGRPRVIARVQPMEGEFAREYIGGKEFLHQCYVATEIRLHDGTKRVAAIGG